MDLNETILEWNRFENDSGFFVHGSNNGMNYTNASPPSLYDQPILVEIRIAVLWICAILGILGWCHRMILSDPERIEVVLISEERSSRAIAADFNTRHPESVKISHSTVANLLARFPGTGSVKDASRSGRPRTSTDPDASASNGLVLLWIVIHRSRRSRIILLILHLTLSDQLVVFCATLPQIVWEYAERVWTAGDIMCRFFKFLQTFSISASNFMVVVLAIDRYYAIRRPLKKPLKVSHITGAAWGLACLINVSNIFLYSVTEHKGHLNCRSKLYDEEDMFYFKLYMTVIALFIFFFPLIIICGSYLRIFQKIAEKAAESEKSKRSSIKPGKVHLQATPSSSLPRAKVKTLKMTIVIVLSFFVCCAPYFICEMIRFYGNQTLSAGVFSVLAALAVSNSSINPFVFLAFNSTLTWWSNVCCCFRRRSSNHSTPTHTSVRISEVINTEEMNLVNGRKSRTVNGTEPMCLKSEKLCVTPL